MILIYDIWCTYVMHDIQIVLMWTTSNFALRYLYKYYIIIHIYYHIISICIHYKCKHKKQVFPYTTWTLKSLYNAGHKLKHFWSQIVPGHKLKHYVVTNRAAVTNWSESQIVPSHQEPNKTDKNLAGIGNVCVSVSRKWKCIAFVLRHLNITHLRAERPGPSFIHIDILILKADIV